MNDGMGNSVLSTEAVEKIYFITSGDGASDERRLRLLLRQPCALHRHPRRPLHQPRVPQHQHLPVSGLIFTSVEDTKSMDHNW